MSPAEIEVAAEAAFISIACSLRGGLYGKIDLQMEWDLLPDPVKVAFRSMVKEIIDRIGDSKS